MATCKVMNQCYTTYQALQGFFSTISSSISRVATVWTFGMWGTAFSLVSGSAPDIFEPYAADRDGVTAIGVCV